MLVVTAAGLLAGTCATYALDAIASPISATPRDALPGIVNVPESPAPGSTAPASPSRPRAATATPRASSGPAIITRACRDPLAASVRPVPWLAFGLRLDGRYDQHERSGGRRHERMDRRSAPRPAPGDEPRARLPDRRGARRVGAWQPGHRRSSCPRRPSIFAFLPPMRRPTAPGSSRRTPRGRWDNSTASAPDADRGCGPAIGSRFWSRRS